MGKKNGNRNKKRNNDFGLLGLNWIELWKGSRWNSVVAGAEHVTKCHTKSKLNAQMSINLLTLELKCLHMPSFILLCLLFHACFLVGSEKTPFLQNLLNSRHHLFTTKRRFSKTTTFLLCLCHLSVSCELNVAFQTRSWLILSQKEKWRQTPCRHLNSGVAGGLTTWKLPPHCGTFSYHPPPAAAAVMPP